MAEGSKSGGYCWHLVSRFTLFFCRRKEDKAYVFGQNFTFRHDGLDGSILKGEGSGLKFEIKTATVKII